MYSNDFLPSIFLFGWEQSDPLFVTRYNSMQELLFYAFQEAIYIGFTISSQQFEDFFKSRGLSRSKALKIEKKDDQKFFFKT